MPGVDLITLHVKSQSIQRYPERERETLDLKQTATNLKEKAAMLMMLLRPKFCGHQMQKQK